MPDDELWTIDQVRDFLGAATNKSASRTLSRWGVKATDYSVVGGKARARFQAEQIRTAQAERPGRGARTDLAESNWPLMAVLADSPVGHAARPTGDEGEVVTLCGITAVPVETDPENGSYCPDCDEQAKASKAQ